MVMVGITALTLAYTQKERGHVRMGLVIDKLRGKAGYLLESGTILVCLAFSILFLVMTAQSAQESVAIQEIVEGVSGLPIWPWKIIIPIGFLFLSLRLSIQFITYFRLFLGQQRQSD